MPAPGRPGLSQREAGQGADPEIQFTPLFTDNLGVIFPAGHPVEHRICTVNAGWERFRRLAARVKLPRCTMVTNA